MAAQSFVRYNIRSLQSLIATLEDWVSQSSDTLDTAESADYPNDERIDALQSRIDALQSAVDSLQEIE